MNKAHYLKWLGVLPESFDEFSKNAKNTIFREWEELSDTELAQFDSITKMAIKYQSIVRSIQQRENQEHLDSCAILKMHLEHTK